MTADVEGSEAGTSGLQVAGRTADRAIARSLPIRSEWFRIATAAVLVLGVSSAPWIFLQFRILEEPLFASGWPYVFSYWLTAILASAWFVHDVVPSLARFPSWRWWVVGPTLALGVWALLSSWWTLSPERTPTEALLLSLLLVGGMWLGYGLPVRTQVWVLYATLHVLVIGSYLIATRKKLWGVDPYGNWQGLFANRNTLGPTATLGVLVAIAAAAYVRSWALRALIVLPLAALDLYVAKQAGSVTAWLALAAGTAAGLLAAALAWAARRSVPRQRLVAMCVAFGVLVLVLLPVLLSVLGGLGRGETFSGRRVVWDFALDQARERPLHGYGFSSFWDHADLIEAFNLRTNGRWDSSHSSFVEMLLWCGLIGFLLTVLVVVVRAVALMRALLDGAGRAAIVGAAVLAFVIVENLAESMVGYHALFWVLLVAVVGGDDARRRTTAYD